MNGVISIIRPEPILVRIYFTPAKADEYADGKKMKKMIWIMTLVIVYMVFLLLNELADMLN